MSTQAKIYCTTTLIGVGAILCVLAGRSLTGHGEVPATSISDSQDSPSEKPVSPYMTHQPTILRADAAWARPGEDPPQAARGPSSFHDYVRDDETPTLRDASPADFLPIPSLDVPERQ